MENLNEEKRERAKKRVDELKGFYIHATVYAVINTIILVNIFVRTDFKQENFWQFGHFFTPLFWGIGLLFHGLKVFDLNPFFGKAWEERQIKKYMEEDKETARKIMKRKN